MTDLRQIPLFQNQPVTTADLNTYSELRYTIPLFQQHLQKEGLTKRFWNSNNRQGKIFLLEAGV